MGVLRERPAEVQVLQLDISARTCLESTSAAAAANTHLCILTATTRQGKAFRQNIRCKETGFCFTLQEQLFRFLGLEEIYIKLMTIISEITSKNVLMTEKRFTASYPAQRGWSGTQMLPIERK